MTKGGLIMKKTSLLAFVLLTGALVILGPATAMAESAAGTDANAAFERLKSMEGTWTGSAQGEGEAAEEDEGHGGEVKHVFAVSAAGTVVMETMMPGTDHEMINMYHLDGEELVLTHYCAGGNQPTMRMNRAASTADSLSFDFTGGSNLNPAKDPHIHSAKIVFKEGGKVQSNWFAYNAGEEAGQMSFNLARN